MRAATRCTHSGLNPPPLSARGDHNAGTQRNDNWCDIICPSERPTDRHLRERKSQLIWEKKLRAGVSRARSDGPSDLSGFLIRLKHPVTDAARRWNSTRVRLFKQARKKISDLMRLHSLRCGAALVKCVRETSAMRERAHPCCVCIRMIWITRPRVRLDFIFTRLCGPIFSLGNSGGAVFPLRGRFPQVLASCRGSQPDFLEADGPISWEPIWLNLFKGNLLNNNGKKYRNWSLLKSFLVWIKSRDQRWWNAQIFSNLLGIN